VSSHVSQVQQIERGLDLARGEQRPTRGLRSLRRCSLPIATGISSEPCPRSTGSPITARVGTVRGIRVGTPSDPRIRNCRDPRAAAAEPSVGGSRTGRSECWGSMSDALTPPTQAPLERGQLRAEKASTRVLDREPGSSTADQYSSWVSGWAACGPASTGSRPEPGRPGCSKVVSDRRSTYVTRRAGRGGVPAWALWGAALVTVRNRRSPGAARGTSAPCVGPEAGRSPALEQLPVLVPWLFQLVEAGSRAVTTAGGRPRSTRRRAGV
jgi:hypothetical protein